MKLSTKSWHYKLYSITSEYSPNDTCAYIRGVLKSILEILTISIFVIMALYLYFYGAYSFYMFGFEGIPMIVKDYIFYSAARFSFLIVSAVVLLVGLIILWLTFSRILWSIYENYKHKRNSNKLDAIYIKREETHPSFFSIVWNKFKNKVCHKIELTY